jgi:methionyl-tRNA formyltransferase
MKVIYMGTPDFAVGALKSVIEAGHEVALVVTQPDKVRARGHEVSFCPVKECALSYGLPVFQPERIRNKEAVDKLKSIGADIFIVAAFGQILSEEILNIPKYGCINIHASLLPMYRGAAPIQWAILNGEKKSGVTIMQMDEGLDTGDMLLKGEVEITDEDTADSLHDKLSELGADLIVEALAKLEKGELTPTPQPEGPLFYAKMIKKEDGAIDFNDTAENLERKVRGFYSWPAAFALYNGSLIKFCFAKAVDEESSMAAGEVCKVDKDAIYIQTGKGVLKVTAIQIQGKKAMSVKDFLLGRKINVGEKFEKYE